MSGIEPQLMKFGPDGIALSPTELAAAKEYFAEVLTSGVYVPREAYGEALMIDGEEINLAVRFRWMPGMKGPGMDGRPVKKYALFAHARGASGSNLIAVWDGEGDRADKPTGRREILRVGQQSLEWRARGIGGLALLGGLVLFTVLFAILLKAGAPLPPNFALLCVAAFAGVSAYLAYRRNRPLPLPEPAR